MLSWLLHLYISLKSVHSHLPNTTRKDIQTCKDYPHWNLQRETLRAKTCMSRSGLDTSRFYVPKCFVILRTSPDVKSNKKENYITTWFWDFSQVFGFYDRSLGNIFVVENSEPFMSQTYRHELQHHLLFLNYRRDDRSHEHSIWNKCAPKRYSS